MERVFYHISPGLHSWTLRQCCSVSRQFLPFARERLWRNLHLDIIRDWEGVMWHVYEPTSYEKREALSRNGHLGHRDYWSYADVGSNHSESGYCLADEWLEEPPVSEGQANFALVHITIEPYEELRDVLAMCPLLQSLDLAGGLVNERKVGRVLDEFDVSDLVGWG
ncbi:hypothetical protein JCM10213_000571 [Rhodosporidiobolus nylandii]